MNPEDTELGLSQLDVSDLNLDPPVQYQLPQQPKKLPRGMYEYVKPPTRKEKKADFDIHNIRPMADLRTPSVRGGFDEGLYNSLINVILNHKKEIKKVPANTLKQAQRYANRLGEGYRAELRDMNPGDGLNEQEVVVFNRAGQPVAINGYKLTPSRYPYRRDYVGEGEKYGGFYDLDGDGTPDKRASKREWFDSKYGFKPGANPWDDGTLAQENVPQFNSYADVGYARLAKPRANKSVYQVFSKLFAPHLKAAYKSNDLTILNKLFPPLMIAQAYYLTEIVYPYAIAKGLTGFDSFSSFIKTDQGKAEFKQFFLQNFIKDGGLVVNIDKFFSSSWAHLKGASLYDYLLGGKDVSLFQKALVKDGEYVKPSIINEVNTNEKRQFWYTMFENFNILNKFVIRQLKNFTNGVKGSPPASLMQSRSDVNTSGWLAD